MPIDVAPEEQQGQDDDLLQQALRAGLSGAPPARPATGQPVSPVAGVRPTPPALDTDLMRHAMSSGAKLSPPDAGAPEAPSIPARGTPAVVRTAADRSTVMPPAPQPGVRLGDLIQQRAKAGTPLDPNDPKYKMGWGERILDTVGNFASNFATRGHSPTTYVGKGATNTRFDRDTTTQEKNVANLDKEISGTEQLNRENESLYRDAIRQAYESQTGQARQETAEARKGTAAAQQETADVRKQAEAAKEGARDISYDPQTKRFQQGGRTYVPKTIEEGASLEAANGVKGYYTNLWDKERKNQPQQPHTPQFSARDNLRLQAKAKELGKSIDDLSDDEINSAIYQPRAPGKGTQATFKDSAAVDKYSDQWYAKQREAVRKEKAEALRNAGGSAKDAQGDYKQIEDSYNQRTQEFEARKKDWYTQVKGGKPVTVNTETHEAVGATPQAASPAAPAQAAAAPAPAPAPAPSAKPQRKVGDVVPTKQGNMKITKILPNGKYEGVPAGS